jgi:hypothetical protein
MLLSISTRPLCSVETHTGNTPTPIHATSNAKAWLSKAPTLRPNLDVSTQVPTINQSRILAGTNLRTTISRMTYRLKHAGEDKSATESRESAGMVTYERTSVLHIKSALFLKSWRNQAHLLNLRVDAVNGTEPLPSERLYV